MDAPEERLKTEMSWLILCSMDSPVCRYTVTRCYRKYMLTVDYEGTQELSGGCTSCCIPCWLPCAIDRILGNFQMHETISHLLLPLSSFQAADCRPALPFGHPTMHKRCPQFRTLFDSSPFCLKRLIRLGGEGR